MTGAPEAPPTAPTGAEGEGSQAPRSVWKALAFTYKMFFWCVARSAPRFRVAQHTARKSSIILSISAFALGNPMLGVSVVGLEER